MKTKAVRGLKFDKATVSSLDIKKMQSLKGGYSVDCQFSDISECPQECNIHTK